MTNTNIQREKIIGVEYHDPFSYLGMHRAEDGRGLVVRVFSPAASNVSVVPVQEKGRLLMMTRTDPRGMFELTLGGVSEPFEYTLKYEWPGGEVYACPDPYSFLPVLSSDDLYLFAKGDHHRVYEKLGGHVSVIRGIPGVHFAVWAPNARNVSVIGDFNGWDNRPHQMRSLGGSGVWELFVPGIGEKTLYKFDIRTQEGNFVQKADPYGTLYEERPRTASIVKSLETFSWSDRAWIEGRGKRDYASLPASVYEVHLGSWMRNAYEGGRWHSYRELAQLLVQHVKSLGFTHIELMPVMEHPFDASWGYQVTGYFAPTSRFGGPDDLMYLVNLCHENSIGVILDWVPAHFPKDEHALARFDGTHLYEHEDPRKGEHQDWGTLIFNYGRNEVKTFLASNALFWVDKYHVDGLRIDAVASMLYLDYSRKEGEWIPNQFGGRENIEAVHFVKHVNGLIHHYYPGVMTIAEESTAWPGVTAPLEHGGLGFTMKWNMGWMHDMLQYFSRDPVHRPFHHGNLTFTLLYAFSERFMLPLSHDEVVHGKGSLVNKMPGDEWQQFANVRALYALMFAFPGKKLLFMGGEFGQRGEWNHDAQLDWYVRQFPLHGGLEALVRDLNDAYRREKSLHEKDFSYQGFEWIDFHDVQQSVIAFTRWSADRKDHVIVACNFTPVPRYDYRIGVPESGGYSEILNTDSIAYGGSNAGNAGSALSEEIGSHGKSHSLCLTLPPLSVLYLKPG